MIKGCNKRVIVMKETGSDAIEEAFFILKPGVEKGSVKDSNIIKHAQGIIDRHENSAKFSSYGMNVMSPKRKRKAPLQFVIGVVVGVILATILL